MEKLRITLRLILIGMSNLGVGGSVHVSSLSGHCFLCFSCAQLH